MRKTQHSSSKSETDSTSVSSARLPKLIDSYIITGDISRLSERTTEARRDLLARKLVWFLRDRDYHECDRDALRQFLHHVTIGHKEPGGRWGNPRNNRPTKPRTTKNYYVLLKAFFNWMVAEQQIGENPMNRIPAPIDHPDQIKPFSAEQILALLAATKKTLHPKRDEAILLLLFDTGIRASELTGLRCRDIDLQGGTVTVEGKGGKQRHLPISRDTKRSIFQYISEREWEDDEPLFLSDRGANAGGALTRHGLRFLIGRIAKVAGVEGVRCSPHTLRHSFALAFLRAGGNVFSLQTMLGHTNQAMTARYVALSEADVANQHRQFSPVANLRGQQRR